MQGLRGRGEFLDDPLETFGSSAVVKVPDFQLLLRHICEVGFEHHSAMSPSQVVGAVAEGLETYVGWDVYLHG